MKQYPDDKTMEDDDSHLDINSQDDGLPLLCECGNVFECNEGYKSGISDKLICESCHVDEMVEKEKSDGGK